MTEEDPYLRILGKKILRTEYEEDERLAYLTLKDMFVIVSLISDAEQHRESKVDARTNEVKRKMYAELKRALERKEDA